MKKKFLILSLLFLTAFIPSESQIECDCDQDESISWHWADWSLYMCTTYTYNCTCTDAQGCVSPREATVSVQCVEAI
jgi:hypothetical protein